VTIERIDIFWPREPDCSRLRPEDEDVCRNRPLPFDQDDPLLFHVLTELSPFGTGEDELLHMMQEGVVLVPRADLGRDGGLVHHRDKIAGDDHYIFLSPCNLFSRVHDAAKANPVVAFRLSTVLEYGDVAFRAKDLEYWYAAAEQMAPEAEEWFDDDVIMIEPSEEEIAESVRDELEEIARCGTQYDHEKAALLVELYARMCGAFRHNGRFGIVDDDDPEKREIANAAALLMPECLMDNDLSYRDDLGIGRIIDGISDTWADLFGFSEHTKGYFPHELLLGEHQPEVMLDGQIPLCAAEWYRDGRGAWRPVPEWCKP